MSSIRQRLPVHVVLLLAGGLSLFPLYWLFLTSLSPTQYVVRVPPEIVPRELTGANYVRLFETTPIVRWLINTVVIAGVVTAFHLLFDSMAGYAFAKRRFPGKNVMFWLLVITLPVPARVTKARQSGRSTGTSSCRSPVPLSRCSQSLRCSATGTPSSFRS